MIYWYRLARIDAFGLLYKWQADGIQKDAAPCLRKIDEETSNTRIKGDNKKGLTLEGLSGAFLVLGIGYSLAIAAFIVELVHGFMRKRNQLIRNRAQPAVKIELHPMKKESNVEKGIEMKSEGALVDSLISVEEGKEVEETKSEIVVVGQQVIMKVEDIE